MTLADEVRTRLAMPSPEEARLIRTKAGVTQRRLGRELGVTEATVSRWEAGHRRPRGASLLDYARLLDELKRVA